MGDDILPIPPLRYFFAEGDTLDQMRDHARSHPIAREGDMKLAWVNEGDLYNHSALFPFFLSAASAEDVRAGALAVANALDAWADAQRQGRQIDASITGLRDMAKVVRALIREAKP